MTARLNIVEQRPGNITVLRMSGRLELDEGDIVFRDCVDRLVAEGRVFIVLDLQAVTRIDSAGIGMMVSKYLSLRRRGGTMKLLHLTPRCGELLHTTRLNTVFDSFDDETAALRSFDVAT